MRNAGTFAGTRGAGRILARVAPYPVHDAHLWFDTMGATKRTRILDVGCGSGTLLRDLRDAGFEFLLGVDPLIPPAVAAESRGLIRGVLLDELHGEFDVIMMHHSLEHIPDQVGTMRAAAALLPAGGWCLVRVPTSDSWAWETYREHWVQLDAPRHFFLHSIESLTRLGICAGLRLAHVADDSGELQFIGSGLYANDRPLTEMARPRLGARRRWRRMARALNAKRRGDQVACYFRKD
jgi:SAM-dependent methyltransferase